MSEPKTEIDRRLDRIELAIGTMATWLVQAQTGFNAKDAEGIEKILKGTYPKQEEYTMSEVEATQDAAVPGKCDVYRVVYTGNGPDGIKNYTALVFRAPVEGTVFLAGQMFGLPGAFECAANEQGEIPQIETEEKGVSWSWQK